MKTYSGQVPQKIVKLQSSQKIEKGAKVYKNVEKREEAGKITSSIEYKGGYFYLATVKKPFYQKGEELEDISGKKVKVCL